MRWDDTPQQGLPTAAELAAHAQAEDVRDTLIDCMTSFGIFGDTAWDVANFILSPMSGLSVTPAEDQRSR